jgi:hypothetical protein
VRALEVVVVDVEPDSSLGIGQVKEDGAFDTLSPERPPESLDLPQGLGMPRRAHDVPDPQAVEFPAEAAPPAPGHVLGTVVGEDFIR